MKVLHMALFQPSGILFLLMLQAIFLKTLSGLLATLTISTVVRNNTHTQIVHVYHWEVVRCEELSCRQGALTSNNEPSLGFSVFATSMSWSR